MLQPCHTKLLQGEDPPVFAHRTGTVSDILFTADHAGALVPPALHNLGSDLNFSDVHFGCDIGLAALMGELHDLGAETFNATYSRAVIDLNRALDDPRLIPAIQDGITIPGNASITAKNREQRIAELYTPYWEALNDLAQTRRLQNPKTLYMAVHTMEKQLEIDSFGIKTDGKVRPPIALVFREKEDALAGTLAAFFRENGIADIGMNVPYCIRNYPYPPPIFAWHQPKMPLIMIEFRNDLLRDPLAKKRYAALLLEACRHIITERADTLISG